MRHKVFIIHGQDSDSLLDLNGFLISLSCQPIILNREDDCGLTIIEKFERYAETCEFAFALLTPDDRQASDLGLIDKWRARQNVILELGWFMHKLGREKVALLHKGEVELPSDLLGVLYMPFKTSIFELSDMIRSRLRVQGLLP